MRNNIVLAGPCPNSRLALNPFAAIFLAASLLASTALAGTRTVDNLYDDGPGSLRDAVRNSASGDTIVFSVTGLLPLMTGEIRIDHDLTITGPATGLLELNGTNGRAFNVAAGRVTISKMTMLGSVLGASAGASPGADADGGAILNSATLTITDCAFRSSFAVAGSGAPGGNGRGGAIANYGSLTLLRTVIFGATAVGGSGATDNVGQTGGTGAGGAIYNGGTLTLINSSIDGCVATGGSGGYGDTRGGAGGTGTAGGIYNAGNLSVENSTIAANRATGGNGGTTAAGANGNGGASFGAGVAEASGAVVTMRNTVVAANAVSNAAGGTATGPDVAGTITSWGHNLIGRTDASNGWNATDLLGGTSDATALDPGLGLLQDNGGPTISRAPQAGSPLIDAGDDSALRPPLESGDQRGFPRKVGSRIDIGAVERGTTQTSGVFTVTTTDQHNDGTCSTDDCSFLEAVNAANAASGPSTIDFVPGLTGTIEATTTPAGIALVSPITIKGPGARNLAVTGVGEGRVFFVSANNVVISGLTIRSGYRYGEDGSGIYNTGSVTVNDCTFLANNAASAPHGGAAFFNANGATASVLRSTFVSNFTDREGAGVYNQGAFTATNCTFAKNVASNGGSVLSRPANGSGSTTLRNCTITGSTAFGVGAGIQADGAPQQFQISNSIVSANLAFAGNSDVSGSFASDGHNLIGSAGSSAGFVDGVKGDQVGSDSQPRDAMLSAIGDNGGSMDTVALFAGSPAINAGDDSLASSADERGLARNGTSDIGAFEFNGLPPSVTLVSAVSRKTHGATVIDLPLPITGQPAIESRIAGTNGTHTVVLTFSNALTAVGSASVSRGVGSVRSGGIAADPHQYIVELTGVSNAQTLTVTLANVTDASGSSVGAVSVSLALLLGDANGDGIVNAADTQITRLQSGSVTDSTNFRVDYNADGTINSADASIARALSGTFVSRALPGAGRATR
ncbi:MAG: hypothetical protein M3032_10145 [Verrucomicrobiota bacterium]|nr:hypothetical protein [Verrucomicrobiota bacterium]